MRRLAAAAMRIGEDLDVPALTESGPYEARQAAAAFNRMQGRLRHQLEERGRFLAAVSHNLRTPLTHGMPLPPGTVHMPMESARSDRAALFVDLENLVIHSLSIGLNIDFDPLLNRLAQYGTLSVRRSFGDLDKAIRNEPRMRQPVRRALMRGMIQHEDVPYLTEHKNSADVRLVVEALSIAYQYPDIGTFILVSSDRDYLPLIAKLRELGRTVVGVGISPDATNGFYVRACDEFLYYESLFARSPGAPGTAVPEPGDGDEAGNAAGKLLDDYCRLLAEAVATVEQRAGRCTGAATMTLMRQLRPDFDLARADLAAFRDLARIAAERGLIAIELQPGSDMVLERISEGTGTQGLPEPAPPMAEDACERFLCELLKCPLLAEADRLAIYSAAASVLETLDEESITLNALKDRVASQLAQATVTSNQIFKLLYSIYRRGAFRCRSTEQHYNPQLFGIAAPIDDWDRLFVLAMLVALAAAQPPLVLKPEPLAELLYGDRERAQYIRECLDGIAR